MPGGGSQQNERSFYLRQTLIHVKDDQGTEVPTVLSFDRSIAGSHGPLREGETRRPLAGSRRFWLRMSVVRGLAKRRQPGAGATSKSAAEGQKRVR